MRLSKSKWDLCFVVRRYLPCRIIGDRLQAIFSEVNKENSLDWSVVLDRFATIAELDTPWPMAFESVVEG
jgi:hypothetical protein